MKDAYYNLKTRVSGTITTVHVGRGSSINEAHHALESRIFRDWAASVDPRFEVREVEIQQVDYRGKPSPDKVMFIRLAVTGEGLPFRTFMELRGEVVVLLPVVHTEEGEFTILVKQPRLASGHYAFAELPAGMCDGDDPEEALLREAKEELGIELSRETVVDLSARVWTEGTNGPPIFSTPGFLDERFHVYSAEVRMTYSELVQLDGKRTGNTTEGESITLEVIRLSELCHRVRDAQSIVAYMLYLEYKR